MMATLLILFFIISEAIYEALYDKGQKDVSAIVEFAHKACMILFVVAHLGGAGWAFGLYTDSPGYLLVGWILLRFALFDSMYSLVRGKGILYFGTVKAYDKIMFKILEKSGLLMVLFFKFIALAWGLAWVMGWRLGITL